MRKIRSLLKEQKIPLVNLKSVKIRFSITANRHFLVGNWSGPRGTCAYLRGGGELVEDVVVPLLGRLRRDPRLLQEVVPDHAAPDLAVLLVEAHLRVNKYSV